MKRTVAWLLAFMLAAFCIAAAEQADVTEAVLALASPYYEAAVEVAQSGSRAGFHQSPDGPCKDGGREVH